MPFPNRIQGPDSKARGDPQSDKHRIIPIWIEIIIYVGLLLEGSVAFVLHFVKDLSKVSSNLSIAILACYVLGAVIVTLGGLIAVVYSRKHQQLPWFIMLFLGSCLTVLSPLVSPLFTSRVMLLYYVMVGSGYILTILAISQVSLFRHAAYKGWFKLTLVIGVTLCYFVAIRQILGDSIIPYTVGLAMSTGSYVLGCIFSHRNSQEHRESGPESEALVYPGHDKNLA
jgi:hypothetical protein